MLVLTPDFPPALGGIQVLVHRLLANARRIDPLVVALGAPGAGDFDREQPFPVRRVGRVPGGRKAANAVLNARGAAAALRFRPEVVLSAHIVTSPGARAAGALTRAPVVQYFHADEISGRPRLAGSAARGAALSIAVSSYTRDLVRQVGGAAERIRVLPNGVDLPGGERGRRAARPTLLTVARLVKAYKGHDVLARALPLVRARVPDVEWVIVGDGPLRPKLERLVADQGVAGSVRFEGALPDAERDAWLDRAHVFAMPSRVPEGGGGEGFGIVYLEAAARGIPAVAGNVGGALDAVVHAETGLLVDPTDHVAVADAVSELLADPGRAEALGRKAADRARQFAWPAIAERLEDLLIEARGKGRA